MIVISATGDFSAQAFLRISRIVQGTNIMIVQSMVNSCFVFFFHFHSPFFSALPNPRQARAKHTRVIAMAVGIQGIRSI